MKGTGTRGEELFSQGNDETKERQQEGHADNHAMTLGHVLARAYTGAVTAAVLATRASRFPATRSERKLGGANGRLREHTRRQQVAARRRGSGARLTAHE